MTPLEEIKEMTDDFITAEQASKVLHCDAQGLRTQARLNPSVLGFEVNVIKKRVRIPRLPFIQYVEGRDERRI